MWGSEGGANKNMQTAWWWSTSSSSANPASNPNPAHKKHREEGVLAPKDRVRTKRQATIAFAMRGQRPALYEDVKEECFNSARRSPRTREERVFGLLESESLVCKDKRIWQV